MKDLSEIKHLFENKDYNVRSEFINDYDFNDNYREYYLDVILKSTQVKDHLYLSDLIDLSSWIQFYDIRIRKRWFGYLFKKKHYTVKLAVLDYFKYCEDQFLFNNYERKLNALLKGRMQSILRNQILFNLICLNSPYKELYVEALIRSLTRTSDWRSIYRTLNNLSQVKVLTKIKKRLIGHIADLHAKKNFGEGVQALLGR